MNYIIELDKHDLARLKRILKAELKRETYYREMFTERDDESGEALADYEATQLIMLLGKLNNIIPVADKITV